MFQEIGKNRNEMASGNFFFILYQFWVGNSFYCISEILGSKHFLVTLEMCMETWNIIPFHFMGIYNNLKYLIYSIKYLKITILGHKLKIKKVNNKLNAFKSIRCWGAISATLQTIISNYMSWFQLI